jgi:hypothetical protein
MPSNPRLTDPDDVRAFVRTTGKDVVTFVGYSARGYQDPEMMRTQVRAALRRFDPWATIVNGGATEAGIGGVVYAVAKELGFATIGIVSSLALDAHEPVARGVDNVFHVRDATWGGCLPGSTELSPTSQAMVDASSTVIGIGGEDAARDELRAAIAAGKHVEFFPADMNHALARSKARGKHQPEPADFRGSAHRALLGA